MHNAQRMLEAIVNGSGIDQADETELANMSQPLNPRMVQDPPFIFGDEDGAVDGITDFIGLGHSADFPKNVDQDGDRGGACPWHHRISNGYLQTYRQTLNLDA